MSKPLPAVRAVVAALLMLPLVSACDGDHGDDGDIDKNETCGDSVFVVLVTGGLCALAGPPRDYNERPRFTSGYDVSVPEHQVDTGYRARATDPDGKDHNIRYSLVGGNDKDAFGIGAESGKLVLVTAPDFENPTDYNRDNLYSIQIEATDGEGAGSSRYVRVTVTDVRTSSENNYPRFTSTTTVTLPENTTGTAYTATAGDPEGDSITYGLLAGYDAGDFSIDPDAGTVRFVSVPDFEQPADGNGDNRYRVEIEAADDTGLASTQRVDVTVADVNETPAFTSGTAASVLEGVTDTRYVAAADDPDGDLVTYRLVGGVDRGAFGIDAESGALRFAITPDFEQPGDDDGDNDYAVEIEAADGNGASATRSVTVSVTDVQGLRAWVEPGDDPKELAFTWVLDAPAPASFRLEVNPDGASGYSPADVDGDDDVDANDEVGGGASALELMVPVHRTDFANARYQVVAVDANGNALIRSNELPLFDLVVEHLVGYVKASNPGWADHFGTSVALSGDGATLAVAGSRTESVYVFTRDHAGGWSQQAIVDGVNTAWNDRFGSSVALSADGTTLAVGAPEEDSAATGVDGEPFDNSVDYAGAVYVFTRDTAGSWAQQAYVKSPRTGTLDFFGRDVALSGSGDTLVVGAPGDDASRGAAFIYGRDQSGTWTTQASLEASNAGAWAEFGHGVDLSGDGDTLAVGALLEDSSLTGVTPGSPDAAATSGGADDSGAAYVFTLDGSGTWIQQAYLKASNTGADDLFGASVALSSNGDTLAVGASGEDSDRSGVIAGSPDADTTGEGAAESGAVYLFTRDALGTWSQFAYVKASNPDRADRFGVPVALDAGGGLLAVGAELEDSAATGLDDDQADDAASAAGATYVFAVDSFGSWAQQAYVKASNTAAGDGFGGAIALSTSGDTLAVGAGSEDGASGGLDGDQSDDSLRDAGAVYLY